MRLIQAPSVVGSAPSLGLVTPPSSSSSESTSSLSGKLSCRNWATNLTEPCMVRICWLFFFYWRFMSAKIASLIDASNVLLKNFLTGIF